MISNLTQKPEIIIVDDNLSFRQCLIFLITIDNVATVIGKASNGNEFIELLSHLKPDLVLIDINILQMNGLEAIQFALEKNPDLKIIAFTMYGDEEYYYKMNSLGIKGFILKSAGVNELEKAIQKVMKGEKYLSDGLQRRFIINFQHRTTSNVLENTCFTVKETEVMKYICHGSTDEEIAQKMSVSQLTIKDYNENILEKIGCQYKPQNSVSPIS